MQQTRLEDKRRRMFEKLVRHMELLARMKERMGERYPEAMFLPPVMATEEEREQMLAAMRVSVACCQGLPCSSVSAPEQPARACMAQCVDQGCCRGAQRVRTTCGALGSW
jgi:hypothetical protein